jgi:S-adenosylmethionine synthetase
MARRIAVDILKEKGAKEVYVQLAYAIGYDQPLQATAIVDGEHQFVKGYDLSPKGIIDFLKLQEPIYERTANFGHFGNGFEWR